MVDPRAPSAGTRSGIRLRRSKIKSKTFIRRPRASLAERSVGPGRVHTDERRLSAVARIEPTDPTRSGRPDDGLREIGDRLSSSQAALGVHFVQFGPQNALFILIAGLDPAIHAAPADVRRGSMGHRVKPGGDEWEDLRELPVQTNTRMVGTSRGMPAHDGNECFQQ